MDEDTINPDELIKRADEFATVLSKDEFEAISSNASDKTSDFESNKDSDSNHGSDSSSNQLPEDLQGIISENKRLQEELATTIQYCDDLRHEMDVMKPMLASEEENVRILRFEKINHLKTIDHLQNELDIAKKKLYPKGDPRLSEDLASSMPTMTESMLTTMESLSIQNPNDHEDDSDMEEELMDLRNQLEATRIELSVRGNYIIKLESDRLSLLSLADTLKYEIESYRDEMVAMQSQQVILSNTEPIDYEELINLKQRLADESIHSMELKRAHEEALATCHEQEKQLHGMDQEIKKFEDVVAKLEVSQFVFTTENAKLVENLEKLREQLDHDALHAAEQQLLIEKLELKVQGLQNEVIFEKSLVESMNRQRSNDEAISAELLAYQQRIEELNGEYNALQSTHEELKLLHLQIVTDRDALNQTISAQTEENESLLAKIVSLESQLLADKEALDHIKGDLENEINRLEDAVSYEISKNQSMDQTVHQLTEEMSELKSWNDQYKTTMTALEQAIETHQGKEQKLMEQKAKLSEEKESLQQALDQINEEINEVKSFNGQYKTIITALEQSIEKHTKQEKAFNDQITNLFEEKAALQEAFDRLNDEKSKLINGSQQQQVTKEAQQQQIKELQDEINVYQSHIESLQSQLFNTEKLLTEKDQNLMKLNQLDDSLSEVQATKQQLQGQYDAMVSENHRLHQELDLLTLRAKELENDHKMSHETSLTLQNQLNSSQEQEIVLRNDIKNFESEKLLAENQINDLEKQLAHNLNEKEALQIQINALQSFKSSLQVNYDQLKDENQMERNRFQTEINHKNIQIKSLEEKLNYLQEDSKFHLQKLESLQQKYSNDEMKTIDLYTQRISHLEGMISNQSQSINDLKLKLSDEIDEKQRILEKFNEFNQEISLSQQKTLELNELIENLMKEKKDIEGKNELDQETIKQMTQQLELILNEKESLGNQLLIVENAKDVVNKELMSLQSYFDRLHMKIHRDAIASDLMDRPMDLNESEDMMPLKSKDMATMEISIDEMLAKMKEFNQEKEFTSEKYHQSQEMQKELELSIMSLQSELQEKGIRCQELSQRLEAITANALKEKQTYEALSQSVNDDKKSFENMNQNLKNDLEKLSEQFREREFQYQHEMELLQEKLSKENELSMNGLRQYISKYGEQINELETNNQELIKLRDTLTNALEDRNKRVTTLEEIILEKEKLIEIQISKIQNFEFENFELKNEFEVIKTNSKELNELFQQKLIDYDELQEELKALDHLKRSQEDIFESMRRNINSYDHDIEILEKDLAKSIQENQMLEITVNDVKQSMNQTEEQLLQIITERNHEMDQLKLEKEKLVKEFQEMENLKLNLEEKVNEMNFNHLHDLEVLRNDIQKRNDHIFTLNHEIQLLQNAKKEFEFQFQLLKSQSESSSKSMNESSESFNQLLQEKESIEKQLAMTQGNVNALRQESLAHCSQIIELEEEKKKYLGIMEILENEVKEMKFQKEEMNKTIENLIHEKENISNNEFQKMEELIELKELIHQKDEVNQVIPSLNESIEQLSRQLLETNKKLSSSLIAYQDLQQLLHEATIEIEEKSKKIAQLKFDQTATKKIIQSLQIELDGIKLSLQNVTNNEGKNDVNDLEGRQNVIPSQQEMAMSPIRTINGLRYQISPSNITRKDQLMELRSTKESIRKQLDALQHSPIRMNHPYPSQMNHLDSSLTTSTESGLMEDIFADTNHGDGLPPIDRSRDRSLFDQQDQSNGIAMSKSNMVSSFVFFIE